MVANAGTLGYAPKVLVKPIERMPEKEKYAKMWEHEQYRVVSPGEQWATTFLAQAKPQAGTTAIDFGCGTGRGALMLALFGALKVTMVDFAENCLDPEVRQALTTQAHALSFKVADLTEHNGLTAEYGYCCDVMEHIPTEDVDKVVHNILGSCPNVFFGISTVDDVMGKLIGQKLHLTVKPTDWWLDKLRAHDAVIHWYESIKDKDGNEVACAIYCSAWQDASELSKKGQINIGDEKAVANVRANIAGGWSVVEPHNTQDREIVLLAGGPSLNDSLPAIKALVAEGAAVVTMNGTYKWALDHGFKVGAQIVMDGRPFNKRFLEPLTDYTRYLIASQVDPSVLEGMPKDQTLVWHTSSSDDIEKAVLAAGQRYFPVPGGSTVLLRAIPLMRMLGFKRQHVFGFDSCLMDDKHHAYDQPENNGGVAVPIVLDGRTFWCAPWMAGQAAEFRDLVKLLGDEVELAVYGDGLIAHMLATGAKFSTDSES